MLKVKSLTKRYGKKVILKDVNLNIIAPGIYYLVGENGSGKTTFFKCLLGLEKFYGEIYFGDPKTLFCLYDDLPLYQNLTGYENVVLFTEKRFLKKKILDVASELFGNTEQFYHTKVKNYSLGQKKLVGLLLIKLLSPNYLILDEVTNGLDLKNKKLLKSLLLDFKKTSIVILSGHEIHFYKEIADNYFLLENQQIILIDSERIDD
ncbi:ATP-binding cassette domain-containing protein [Gottfriedia acidiceleris]|uniref:ATP-binding cassette domain-containing protein n=1 Tax=Gottfriedia acidiceleris TaxID=371036 RepID=UPI000B42FE3C|nr:ATP-binding cassette domain-containing protein [Gottfriedia acidiceleris]